MYRRLSGYSRTTTCSPKSFKFTVHCAISVDNKTVDQISINNSQATNSRTHPPTRLLTATTQSACQINNSLTNPFIQQAAPSIACSVSHSLSLALCFLSHGATVPRGPGPPHYRGFTITHSCNLLNKLSTRRTGRCLTTHNTTSDRQSCPR
jgi:hypothetical protein